MAGMRAMPDTAVRETSCLHLVVAAGHRALRDCLSLCRPGDSVLFLDAGVLHLLGPRPEGNPETTPALLFAVADLEAHGLLASARAAGARTADDADFCALLAAHGHCLTWA
jgi:sulfur relay protein TusB/DsrH